MTDTARERAERLLASLDTPGRAHSLVERGLDAVTAALADTEASVREECASHGREAVRRARADGVAAERARIRARLEEPSEELVLRTGLRAGQIRALAATLTEDGEHSPWLNIKAHPLPNDDREVIMYSPTRGKAVWPANAKWPDVTHWTHCPEDPPNTHGEEG